MATPAKEIPLTRGFTALVDETDYVWLSQWKWCATEIVYKTGSVWYAKRGVWVPERRNNRSVYMHREIAAVMGIPHVDHQDGNGLNNSRGNLRPATHAQNHQNGRKRIGCSSHYKGVYWDRQLSKWRAQIQVSRNERYHLGLFEDECEAALAYNDAAIKHFGEFACLNAPTPGS